MTTIEVPAPTAWPIVLAFGTTLLFAGLVTSVAVSALGGVLMIAGGVGWFRDVLPHEAHDLVPARPAETSAATSRRTVAHVEIAGVSPRAWLPLEIYPVSAGIKVLIELGGQARQVKNFGLLQSVSFQGVAPDGMDLFDVTFTERHVQWRIAPLTADGHIVWVGFASAVPITFNSTTVASK